MTAFADHDSESPFVTPASPAASTTLDPASGSLPPADLAMLSA
ncbi:hypothetical protein [Streptosporangium sp. 'caverna']|nr:hypothetical protein [Streptosporangium sp. 'caverna']